MTAEIQATQTLSPIITDVEPGEVLGASSTKQGGELAAIDYLSSQYDPGLLFMPKKSADQSSQLVQALLTQMNTMIQMLFSLVNSLVERLVANKQPGTTPPTSQPSVPAPTNTPTNGTSPQPTPTPTQPAPTTPPINTPVTECKCVAPTEPKTKTKISSPLGGSGFLWKPESEKDGKLVVLLPSKFSGKIKSLTLTDTKGTTLATGTYSGIGNGEREHFRFPKSGASYPDGVRVVVKLEDNTTRYVTIKETSQRYQR